MARHLLDVQRLLCPLPVIRTQGAMRVLAPGDVLEVLATDPGVLQDIPAWCRLNSHKVLSAERGDGLIRIEIEAGNPAPDHYGTKKEHDRVGGGQ